MTNRHCFRPTSFVVTMTLALFCVVSHAHTLTGKVIKIADGDTITVLDDAHNAYRVRLANIDCPEKKQPWGSRAKQAISRMVGNRTVTVQWKKKDRYNRIIGHVFDGNTHINRELVANGHCWVYRKYNKDASLREVEAKARLLKRGVWSLPKSERLPPWIWRKTKK